MEAYAGCGSQVVTFLSSWDSELHALKYTAAVYESFSNIGDLISASKTMTEPDVIHYADWDGKATTASSYMPSAMWIDHQRIHQYQGGHNESWGGAAINIDNDQLDTLLGGGAPAGRAAAASGSPWAATSASRPSGSPGRQAAPCCTTTSSRSAARCGQACSPVGKSPSAVAGNPAVTADANGSLTVFARTAAGRVVHAWQRPGAPGGWRWGGPAARSSTPGSMTGDPAAIRRPDGKVEVFVTLSGGAVSTTWQRAPNANRPVEAVAEHRRQLRELAGAVRRLGRLCRLLRDDGRDRGGGQLARRLVAGLAPGRIEPGRADRRPRGRFRRRRAGRDLRQHHRARPRLGLAGSGQRPLDLGQAAGRRLGADSAAARRQSGGPTAGSGCSPS